MLPGRRRLQQGTRNNANPSSTPNRPRAAATESDEPIELPAYLPQACALNADAIVALRSLNQNLGTSKIDEHIRDSLSFLKAGTASLGATLQSSRYQVDNIGEKKEAEKARLEKEVAKLEDVAKDLTAEAEAAVRELIDLKGGVEDEKAAFENVIQTSNEAWRQRDRERSERRQERQQQALEARENGEYGAPADGEDANGAAAEDDLDDEEEQEEVQALSELIRQVKERKAANYEEMSMYQRYALNNEYADFKRQWHNGLHGEDAVLPDAKRWFSQDGRPVFNFGGARGGDGDEDEEGLDGDTDLIVERETVSTRCPLSLQEMVEPYSNRKCRHTFEKTAILEYIGIQPRVTCPQSGCNAVYGKGDLYLDQAMLARIRRKKDRRASDGEEGEDEDDDDGEDIGSEEDEAEDEEAEEPAPRSARPRRSVKMERDG
ncbi:uncharacterized protein DNG_07524 [Cephalotrichum gorgonifer]|uniref:SP-RING-type domain-containing protein n=1 Tax=Cephalotrichum gorgonifer TaxID=2041049 RepID=A0AAE8N3K4_9PEZI|nr:uncharacterized protein DNG_07524 [Cephalotrichum gorgonifer]